MTKKKKKNNVILDKIHWKKSKQIYKNYSLLKLPWENNTNWTVPTANACLSQRGTWSQTAWWFQVPEFLLSFRSLFQMFLYFYFLGVIEQRGRLGGRGEEEEKKRYRKVGRGWGLSLFIKKNLLYCVRFIC